MFMTINTNCFFVFLLMAFDLYYSSSQLQLSHPKWQYKEFTSLNSYILWYPYELLLLLVTSREREKVYLFEESHLHFYRDLCSCFFSWNISSVIIKGIPWSVVRTFWKKLVIVLKAHSNEKMIMTRISEVNEKVSSKKEILPNSEEPKY